MNQISLQIPPINPLEQLSKLLYNNTLDQFWLGRIITGIHAVGDKKGRVAETAFVIVGIIGTMVFGSAVYFSAEGSYYLFEQTYTALNNSSRVPSQIGHAGEWSSQVIIYSFFFFMEIKKIVRESDYKNLKRTITEWLPSHANQVDMNLLYQMVERNLYALGAECFYPKNALSQRLSAIQIMDNVDTSQFPCQRLDTDRQLKKLLKQMHQEIKQELGLRNYFKRAWRGITGIGQDHGRVAQIGAVVTGVALPLFLGFQSLLSFVGAGLVADEVIHETVAPEIVGHIGEWPANGITFAFMAQYIHNLAILKPGDLYIAREVFLRHLAILDPLENMASGNINLYNRARKVVNAELERIAKTSIYALYPTQYMI